MSKTITDAQLKIDANITHYYTCDSNFNDSVGAANGTDTNTPTYTVGKFSNAFTCVAASSQYTSVANSLLPWGTNTFWLHLWFKLSSLNSTQSFLMTARTGKGVNVYYDGANIVFSKPNVADLSYAWTGEDLNWHMLDMYAGSGGMFIYLDSVQVASNGNTTNFTDPDGDTMTFGAYKSDGAIQAGWYLDGRMDDIATFTRIPTVANIFNLYNGGNLTTMGSGT